MNGCEWNVVGANGCNITVSCIMGIHGCSSHPVIRPSSRIDTLLKRIFIFNVSQFRYGNSLNFSGRDRGDIDIEQTECRQFLFDDLSYELVTKFSSWTKVRISIGGKRNGRGSLTLVNGARFEGDYVNDRQTGKGIYTWSDGDRYEGNFISDQRTGRGIYTWMNGNRYEGDWLDNKQHGRHLF